MATKPRANMEKLITEPTNEQVIVPTVEQRSESELQKEDGGKKSSGRTQKNEETRTPSQTNERQTRTHKLKSCTPQPLSKPCTQDDMPVDPALLPSLGQRLGRPRLQWQQLASNSKQSKHRQAQQSKHSKHIKHPKQGSKASKASKASSASRQARSKRQASTAK